MPVCKSKMFIFLCFVCLAACAQKIEIADTGTVTKGTTAMASALIELENSCVTSISVSDGSFILTSDDVRMEPNKQLLLQNSLSASVSNGDLSVYLPENGVVKVSLFALEGMEIYNMEKRLNEGFHSIDLPTIASGVYLLRIASRGREVFLKSRLHDRIDNSVRIVSSR